MNGRETIFLPWRSEFGLMILRIVRWIHAHPSPRKIICAKRGMEALYPSASGFIYNWEDAPDVLKNTRLARTGEHKNYMALLAQRLRVEYPGAELVATTAHLINDPAWNFRPEPRVRRGLAADVVIGPRRREYARERNYAHWQRLVDDFSRMGLTVAAIGAADTSETGLNGLTHRSWDYDVLDAGIELLQNCKLAVMTDSGGAHLAVLCGAPLKVIHERTGRRPVGGGAWYIDEMKRLAVNHCEPVLHGWSKPENVARDVDRFLEGRNHEWTRTATNGFSEADRGRFHQDSCSLESIRDSQTAVTP